MAAHRAIFGVLLALAGRQVNLHDNLFTARSANVAGFVLHEFLRGAKFYHGRPQAESNESFSRRVSRAPRRTFRVAAPNRLRPHCEERVARARLAVEVLVRSAGARGAPRRRGSPAIRLASHFP